MRLFCLCALCLTHAICLHANDIDQIRSKADVQNFLIKKVSKKFKDEDIFGSKPGSDGTSLPAWFYTMDIDGNGRRDLIVNGREVFVVMDLGKKGYGVYRFQMRDPGFNPNRLVGIDSTQGQIKLILRRQANDTLAWFDGGFMEFNEHPMTDFRLEEISVSTTGCYGTCPVFKMKVDSAGHASYTGIEYNKEQGEYNGVIPAKEFEHMIAILQYLDPDKLDSNYSVDWMDDQTIFLDIKYNGKERRISDYGELGTFGLRRLYRLFFRWKESVVGG